MKKKIAIVAGILVGLLIIAVVTAQLNRRAIIVWMLGNETTSAWLTTFEPSENYNASVEGSYPAAACQSSHVNWGEDIRRTQSLDGIWDVAEGAMSDTPPAAFPHTAPVPGLITEAEPRFTELGVESEQRDAFWYRTVFDAPEEGAAQAYLCLHKARYGVKVWLNGEPLGEHYGAFSLSEYYASGAIRYGERNELIVRLGADRSQLPSFVPAGDDDDKLRWFPGLWDSVSLVLTGGVSIANVKIEPDIDNSQVRITTVLFNSTDAPYEGRLEHGVRPWAGGGEESPVAASTPVALQPNERKEIVQTLSMPTFELWSPESPFLYLASTTIAADGEEGAVLPSDDRAIRFGMRKVEWRAGEDKGFYLNNRLYYLRGTNIGLHRFFEDADRRGLPWDKRWVRELLSGHPKDLHWNSFRNHVGRLPNFWNDLADEIGFIVADEYSFWSVVRGTESEAWSVVELEKEFQGWISENWNHPSIGWWDAANENHNPQSTEVIARVRGLDPTRQWENGGYQAPESPNDPIEEHPYKLNSGGVLNLNDREYTLEDFSTMEGLPPQATWGPFATYYDGESRPYINNEYGFLWMTPRGRPTKLPQLVFDNMTGGQQLEPGEYLEAYAYIVSELSAYWRAMRGYAGVQHFVYLTKCDDELDIPEDWEIHETSEICDNFLDVARLELEPRWKKYAQSAFAPQLIYLKEWRDTAYPRGGRADVPVILLNDDHDEKPVVAEVMIIGAGGEILSRSRPVETRLEPLEKRLLDIPIDVPDIERVLVVGRLSSSDGSFDDVYSRRKIGYDHPGQFIPDPPFK